MDIVYSLHIGSTSTVHIRRVVIDDQYRSPGEAKSSRNIVEKRRIALAFTHAVTVGDVIEVPVDVVLRIEPVQPVDLVAEDAGDKALLAELLHKLQLRRPDNETIDHAR